MRLEKIEIINVKNIYISLLNKMSKKEIAEILKDPIEYANNLEISKLVKLLQKLSDAYYSDIEIVDDSIYDKLEAVLKEKP